MSFPLVTYPTARTRAVPGGREHNPGDQIIYGVNKEATASMPWGRFVCYERSTFDQGMLVPDATTDKLAGVVVQSYAYGDEQLGLGANSPGAEAEGPLPGESVNVITRGKVWCVCDASQTPLPGDPVFVRAVAADPEVEGSVRTAADSSDCIDLTGKAVFRSAPITAPDGSLIALVELFGIGH